MSYPAFTAKIHWLATAVLLVSLVPLLHFLRLPIRFEWALLFKTYWLATPAWALMGFAVFAFANDPKAILKVSGNRLWQQKTRILLLIVLIGFLYWMSDHHINQFIIWIVLTLAILEGYERLQPGDFSRTAKNLALPVLYLFLVLLVNFSYIDVIATVKDFSAFDPLFKRADSFLLAGGSVSNFSHTVLRHLSPSLYSALELIYYSLFSVVGGGIFWLGVNSRRAASLRLVETLATAYYISLFIYWLLPALGPFASCATHAAQFPHNNTYEFHLYHVTYLTSLRKDHSVFSIGLGYFIAFPSMHISLAAITTWFLRAWKRLAWTLFVYDIFLLFSIFALEWHYVVDVIAGLAVTAAAIYMVDNQGNAFSSEMENNVSTELITKTGAPV